MDPQARAQAELDALLKERETELAQMEPPSGDTWQPPAAADQAPPAPDGPAPEEPQPPETPSEPAPDDHAVAVLKQQLETLQGKYNAEVPRLHAELRQKRAELSTLQATVEQLRAAPPADTTPADSNEYRSLVEEYGEAAAKAMLAMARSEASRVSAQVASQVAPLAESVAAQHRNTFHGQIAEHAGKDWLSVNDDARFVDWTNATLEPKSGETYNALLNAAYKAGDAARVAQFFNEFREANAPPAPKTPPPAQATRPTVSEQDAMRAPPNRSTSSQTLTDAAPDKVWSETEINSFYDDQAKGRYVGREKEAKAINATILTALRDGRVIR